MESDTTRAPPDISNGNLKLSYGTFRESCCVFLKCVSPLVSAGLTI